MATCYNDNEANRTSTDWTGWKCDDYPGCSSGWSSIDTESKNSSAADKISLKCVTKWKRRKCKKITPPSAYPGDETSLLKCCTGETPQRSCRPGYCTRSTSCDSFMTNYCQKPKNWREPICGCLLPAEKYVDPDIIGPPVCVDKRCAQNPAAYQTAVQKGRPCDIVHCTIKESEFKTLDQSQIENINIQNVCGSERPIVEPEPGSGIPGPGIPKPGPARPFGFVKLDNKKLIIGIGGGGVTLSTSCVSIICCILLIGIIVYMRKKKNQ